MSVSDRQCAVGCEEEMGTPEIELTVLGVDKDGKTTKVVNVLFEMDSFGQFYDKWLFDWRPENWYQRYTFQAVEVDPGRDEEIDLSANMSYKKTNGSEMEIVAQAAASTKFKFSSPKNLGSADLSFYDPINALLIFQEGDAWCNVDLGQ